MAKSNTTTSFEKMGDSIVSHVLNLSGQRSSYTMSVPKKSGGKSVQTSGKANRSATMIHEANGPKCHVVATLYKANAVQANDVTRGIRLLKPAKGDRDFSPKSYNSAA